MCLAKEQLWVSFINCQCLYGQEFFSLNESPLFYTFGFNRGCLLSFLCTIYDS